jgi:hypothetical protein
MAGVADGLARRSVRWWGDGLRASPPGEAAAAPDDFALDWLRSRLSARSNHASAIFMNPTLSTKSLVPSANRTHFVAFSWYAFDVAMIHTLPAALLAKTSPLQNERRPTWFTVGTGFCASHRPAGQAIIPAI